MSHPPPHPHPHPHDKKHAEVRNPARSILRGELDRIGLPTLLTMLDMERRSGVLIVQRDRQLGRIYIRQGRVLRARTEGLRSVRNRSGAEAVYEMLMWGKGQFELWQAEVDGRDDVRTPTTFLLMEGMRRLDEAERDDQLDDDDDDRNAEADVHVDINIGNQA